MRAFLVLLAVIIAVFSAQEVLQGNEKMSDEQSDQHELDYKYYNNSFVYISFREQYLKDADGKKVHSNSLWMHKVLPVLKQWSAGEFSDQPYAIDIDVNKIKVHKVYPSYLVVKLDPNENVEEIEQRANTVQSASMEIKGKQFCSVLKRLEIILACEYLDRQSVFGDKAGISEMASFKSKVRKQDPVYDP